MVSLRNRKNISRQLIFQLLREGKSLFNFPEYQNDRQVVIYAIQQNTTNFLYVSKELKDDVVVVLTAVRKDGLLLMDASERLRNDKVVVLVAVLSNGYALQFASLALRNDKEIVKAAMNTSFGSAEPFIGDIIRRDAEIEKLCNEWKKCFLPTYYQKLA